MAGSGPFLNSDVIEEYRREFPITERFIYLNHAGVAPTSLRFIEAVEGWLRSQASEGAGPNTFEEWRFRAEQCRRRFAGLVGCSPDEVAIVRNTSHGLGLVAEGIDWKMGQRIAIAKDVEYPSNVHPWTYVARRCGLFVDYVEPCDGVVTVESVKRCLQEDSRLVSVSSAQFGTGAITDLAGLGSLCQDHGVLLCVDGIQTVGVLPVNVKDAGIHFLSADSHKWLLGTMGIGALYVDRTLIEDEQIRPVLIGWKSVVDGWEFDVEKNDLRKDAGCFEEGSPTYAMIDGLSAALALLNEVSIEAIANHVRGLINILSEGLARSEFDMAPPPNYRCHILSLKHPRVASDELAEALYDEGIVVASRRGYLRLSPHFYNTPEEMKTVITCIKELVYRLTSSRKNRE